MNLPLAQYLSSLQQAQLRRMLEKGLPLTRHPYLSLANEINAQEQQVIEQITHWQHDGLIKRFGLVVKHRQLGYVANAMVVWDIEDKLVDEIAGKMSKRDEISLCYRRPRRMPDWPYNLFCMIHGQNRQAVEQQISDITEQLKLAHIPKNVLFSQKAYKQHGARYGQQKTNREFAL